MVENGNNTTRTHETTAQQTPVHTKLPRTQNDSTQTNIGEDMIANTHPKVELNVCASKYQAIILHHLHHWIRHVHNKILQLTRGSIKFEAQRQIRWMQLSTRLDIDFQFTLVSAQEINWMNFS